MNNKINKQPRSFPQVGDSLFTGESLSLKFQILLKSRVWIDKGLGFWFTNNDSLWRQKSSSDTNMNF